METEDPRASLGVKDVSVRAAAARDLARMGTVDDVPLLLEHVRTDKSPSVRLYAAAGAAEILARHRGAYDQAPLDRDAQRAVLQEIGTVDPGLSPSVLLCYAPFPEPAVLKRLDRMLRDPRQDVRLGATQALRRMALSGAATHEGTGVREWVAEALRYPKLPADTAADLIRLIGQVGWRELTSLVERGLGVDGAVGEAATEALERLGARDDRDAWDGIWIDEGRDVLQLATPVEGRWLAVEGARPADGKLDLPEGVARRIWAPRLGEEGLFEALQVDGRTYWRLSGKRLVGFVDEQDTALAGRPDIAGWLLEQLDAQSGAGPQRAAIVLCVRTGRHTEALERLERPLAAKKPRNDLFFLQGLALRAVGRESEGDAALRTYLEKAKASEPWRAEAEALVGTDGDTP
ncbi:MAG: hypothetical protein H6736_17010 [Alphaproteobacteria bacterium]|nr:hypothetical protein [Alphaproteobacteria bacterium]MCB9693514.1 hypothetical protein [Alphaproteobacteria bacterium]